MKSIKIKLITLLMLLTGINIFAQSEKLQSITYNTNEQPEQFIFKYQPGDHYRSLSTVKEDVYVNNQLDHHATIVNRISVEVKDVESDGSAQHDATFMTSENSIFAGSNKVSDWGKEYNSIFYRDKTGKFNMSDEYFMPTLRNIPVFPEKQIVPGNEWTADGLEVQDLRVYFGIDKPYKVPFTATYKYLGTTEKETKEDQTQKKIYVFTAQYSLYFDCPSNSDSDNYNDYPVSWMEFSNQTIFWDKEKGAIDNYNETFRILITTNSGNVLEYRGTAEAEVTDFIRTDTDENINDVQNQINEMQLDNVTVGHGEKGLTISVEDIKFKADSAELLDSEKLKIQKVALILKKYDNDILVSGHTALAGTEKIRQLLSEERAGAVAEYLISLGVRDQYHIFAQGFGANRPIADNTKESGKAKNRRVEITLIDN